MFSQWKRYHHVVAHLETCRAGQQLPEIGSLGLFFHPIYFSLCPVSTNFNVVPVPSLLTPPYICAELCGQTTTHGLGWAGLVCRVFIELQAMRRFFLSSFDDVKQTRCGWILKRRPRIQQKDTEPKELHQVISAYK
jgi:hypothetical protein